MLAAGPHLEACLRACVPACCLPADAVLASIARHLGSGSSRSKEPAPQIPSFHMVPQSLPRCKVRPPPPHTHIHHTYACTHARTHPPTRQSPSVMLPSSVEWHR